MAAVAEYARITIDTENPWPGPEAFSESEERFFRGRRDETAELRRLVSDAPLTVLFGVSGLGKTSLIRAGLFPIVRRDNILPVYIRLETGSDAASLSEQLKAALEREIAAHNVDAPAFEPGESLWLYLHRGGLELWSPQNRLLTPLFVLDQFEEVLSQGLPIELADLVENRVPRELVGVCHFENFDLDSQRYKLLISFREDYLPSFEAWRRAMPSIMRNRFRLLPMSEEQAFAAVYETGGRLVDEAVARRIVQFVAKAQEEDREPGLVDPALLSIFCQGLNERRKAEGKARLDQTLLDASGNRIIQNFYQHAMFDQPPEVCRFIANELITARGLRNSCDVGDAQARHKVTREQLDTLVNRRLLRIEPHGRSERVELTHDVLTRVVRDERDRQQERERARKQRRRTALMGLLLAAVAGLSALFGYLYLQAKEQARLATAGRLAATALLKRDGQFDLTALLGVQGYRTADLLETRSSLLSVFQSLPQRLLAVIHNPGTVSSTAFSPDGKLLATAGSDGTLRLWDVTGRKQSGDPLQGHSKSSWSVAFSRDSKHLASAGADGTVRIWDIATRKQIGEPLTGHKDDVWSVAFSPDGRFLASAGQDRTIRLWGVANRQPVGEPLRGHGDVVDAVTFSPDGAVLASGSWDGTIRLWDLATRQALGEPLKGHEGFAVSVAFAPDGKTLASGGSDQTVRLWDVTSRRQLGEPLKGHQGYVLSVAFGPNGKVLVSGGEDRTVRLWEVGNGKALGEPLRGHADRVYSVAFTPDGMMLASAGEDKTIRFWDARPQALGDAAAGPESFVSGVAFSPNSKLLASGGSDQSVRLWDVETREPAGQLGGHENLVDTVAFSRDGTLLASGSWDGTVRLWDVAGRQPAGDPLRGHRSLVLGVAFSPDGKLLASCSSDKSVRLWDVTTRQPLGELKGHQREVGTVTFSADGKLLASGSADHTARLWDVAARDSLGEPLEGHAGIVHSVAFSPDGKLLATASGDKTVRVWDAASRKQVGEPLKGHSDAVTSVAFSPDGRLLATGSTDKTVRLWDAASRQAMGEPFQGHASSVYSVAFSPDGKLLASGSSDKTLLWSAGAESWIERLCSVISRNLSPAEWRQYAGEFPYERTCPNLLP